MGFPLSQQLLVLFALAFAYFVLYPFFIYVRDSKGLRRFPGVSIAPYTNAWAILRQLSRTRTLAVHEAHMKHGDAVRIGPRHISFATAEAIRDIYGHGTPALKDTAFYGAFVSTHLNVSDAQEKRVHSAKRKRLSIAFAQKQIVQLEPIVHDHMRRLVNVIESKVGTEVDMKNMMLYLMYNIISVTMFNQDPRFLERDSTVCAAETLTGEVYEADLHQAMCRSLLVTATMGWARPESIPFIKTLTGWHSAWREGDRLRDITIHFLRNRLRLDTERIRAGQAPLDDFMTPLLWDHKSKSGKEALCLEFGELVTEASNLFNAAGENTEIALTNIVWLIIRNPRVAEKLREELQTAFRNASAPVDVVPPYDVVKDLPYLRACIDEGLRLRPSLPGGLPRIVPSGGMKVSGHWFEEGTTLSVSTHTVHRDPAIWSDSPDEFIPERWLRPGGNELQRAYLAFSQGSRGCLGRNIAYFEMVLAIATLFSRFHFALRSPDWELGIEETFSAHTKPLPVKVVGIRTQL